MHHHWPVHTKASKEAVNANGIEGLSNHNQRLSCQSSLNATAGLLMGEACCDDVCEKLQ
jgi:hypothetical protein